MGFDGAVDIGCACGVDFVGRKVKPLWTEGFMRVSGLGGD
jgi:hypothetical protein